MAAALLGAFLSSTVGALIVRIKLNATFNFLTMLWLMSFCASFVVVLTYGGNTINWGAAVSICSVFSVIGYFGYDGRSTTVLNDRPWKIGAATFLLTCGAGLALSSSWWISEIRPLFLDDATTLFFLCELVPSVCGLASLLKSR